jgi:hypothetical protein
MFGLPQAYRLKKYTTGRSMRHMSIKALDHPSCASARTYSSGLGMEPFYTRTGTVAGFECPVGDDGQSLGCITSFALLRGTLNKILRFVCCAKFRQCHTSSPPFENSLAIFIHVSPVLVMTPDLRELFERAATALAAKDVQLGLTLSAKSFEEHRGQVRSLKSSMYRLADIGVQFMISYDSGAGEWKDCGGVASCMGSLANYARFEPEWFGLQSNENLSDLGFYQKKNEVLRHHIHARNMTFLCSGVHSEWQYEATFTMPFTLFSGHAAVSCLGGFEISTPYSN